ncbi:SAM-dependent methyltransferase [Bradyrhizobium sp. 180]|uniref:small ribosomal subunit Rsm22 family protein n=1 Tax=unclassified Bradyrhizobium TaxID=2631580 RepID=UPI001FF79255|nr:MULTISPECIES: small ribosomal subunit Rsm22 family protein [unclassified Bradyrhizobium]MCK1423267.1 SAM-dependent methyltransferase [Bradyrhizobium sp. CW12]MCK1493087.1 SAM-dependent methyltransferase [Bradyrhizobium sp. 180]MCK1531391.1 SAM-dependent methyltransferase [Bradyrhizobium sp. 182]MCK1599254.1 SAM-dependent methyltransferase [Bradyrhizobium sp. 164]MCK1617864.1 SAM-dependent methyltransferase [Bradyrhizobium sp. 159]
MIISPTLPAELKAALDARLQGVSRTEAAQRSQKISNAYRSGGGSGTIKSEADALAYALARMPATYAAVAASLNALTAIAPALAPESLLDIGAGPGTASWAAAEAFASLQDFTLLDANATLSRLALELARDSSRLADCRYLPGDAGANLAEVSQADLVVASYVIGELNEGDQRKLAAAMWTKARHALVVIEPGTPAGYTRILALRQQLIAAGAYVAAPCPHDKPCPLIAPDWCHFSQRLPRSQAHRQIKGAEVPFEDERFIYVALTRTPPAPRASRVLAPPDIGKAEITAKLCTETGVALTKVPRRDKPAYSQARRWRWGDAIMSES